MSLRIIGVKAILAMTAASVLLAQSKVTVWTGQYDNNRSGANLAEILLNTSNVNVSHFGKVFTWPVDGWVFAQPLYIPNVTIGTLTTDVVYIATMNNSIYAFDALNLSTTPLWKVTLGPAVPQNAGGNGCPAGGTGSQLGILSTPVIDTTTGTIYAVTANPVSGGPGWVQYMNALDMTNGTHKFDSPMLMAATVNGSGYDSVNGEVTLSPTTTTIQRTALLLSQGIVYAAFTNCGPDIDPWHGWVLGYYASWLGAHTVPFNTTADGERGGIWQSNRGIAADSSGAIYYSTGNGTVGQFMYGDNVLKGNAWGGILDWYTPADWPIENEFDYDLSAGGVLQIPGSSLLVAGGKEGIIYLLDENHMSPAVDSFQATTPCPMPYVENSCFQIHSLAYWGNAGSGSLYIWGGNDSLRAFSFSAGSFNAIPTSTNTSYTPKYVGGTMVISANGTQPGTGILWATVDPQLHAFDAGNVTNELWNSNQNAARDGLPNVAKWGSPTIANGRVYVPTFYNEVVIYGLLQ
jgi:hypothetical protein